MKKILLFLLLTLPLIGFSQPSNDLCSGAITVSDFGCFNGTNVLANDDIVSCAGCQTPNCGQHYEVWYSFTATNSTLNYWLYSSSLTYMEILLYDACGGTLLHSNCGAPTVGGSYSTLTVGSTYYFAISSRVMGTGPFTVCFGAALPIELISFDGYNDEDVNKLSWVTATEINNDYFSIERSTDGMFWESIAIVEGNGNSNTPIMYQYEDDSHQDTVNYYRLKQVDFNGDYEVFDAIAIDNTPEEPAELVRIINFMGQDVGIDYRGLKVYIYSDGTIKKINTY